MPVPTLIYDLSTTAASNYPQGSDSPATLDDTQRAHGAFIAQLRDGKGFANAVTVASATTTDIGGQSSQFVEISGTTTITSLGSNYNGPRFLRFTGILTLTHNATSLNIPGSANITTTVGGTCIATPNVALNGWNIFNYAHASGLAPGVAAAGANSDLTSVASITSINGGPLAGLRNRIINGGMQVAQRGALVITNGVSNYGGCDRTTLYPGGFSTASGTVQQSAFAQASSGFAQWLNVTTTGTGTVQAIQKIEAVNVKDLNSKTVTVSAILYQDTGAALNAVISLYKTGTVDNWATPVLISTSSATSVPSASVTAISKQFTLGASDATNGLFVQIHFQAVGAVASKNFYLGDFQLELGSVATPFEQRPYGMELVLCQRYYQAFPIPYQHVNTNVGTAYAELMNIQPMRVSPTSTVGVAPTYGNCSAFTSNGSTVYSSRWSFTITNAGPAALYDGSISLAAEL